VAGRAAAGLQTSTAEEQDAARWLDAEDAAMRQALAWATDHDPATAARLAGALGWWWWLRGRLPGQYGLLREVAGRAEVGSDGWCWVQMWLAAAANVGAEQAAMLEHATALRDAGAARRDPSPVLAYGLAERAISLTNLGRTSEAAEEARRSLAMGRETGYRAGEVMALAALCFVTVSSGDLDGAVQLARQAAQITAGVPGVLVRWCGYVLTCALIIAGDLAAAGEVCAAALARSRDAGDVFNQEGLLPNMVFLDVHAGRAADAAAHLREALQLGVRTGSWLAVLNCLDPCGYLCADSQIAAELVISVRTVSSHLGRIRAKTGCRRRADLTRLAPGRRPGLARPPVLARAAGQHGTAQNVPICT
jgi:hypothetical protein